MRSERTTAARLAASKFVLGLAIIAALSGAARAQDAASKLDEYMNAATKLGKFSGSVLVAQKGRVLLSKGYGMANYELDVPNTPQTKFRLGSITKQFTAMAIMQLQEKGLLNIDEPVTKYLPDYPKTGDKFTIRNLLNHTAGVPNLTSFPDFISTMTLASPLDKTVSRFKDKPLDFEPGSKFQYSNSGYVLLAAVIEKVSGKSYEAFLNENIFQPLGMKNTGCERNDTVLKNRASGYQKNEDGLSNSQFIHMTIPVGGGNIYSTVEDLYVWDRALYTEKLVKKSTLEQIFTPFKGSYGFGWVITTAFNRKLITHNGGINGFATDLARFVDDDVFIVLLNNFENKGPGGLRRDLSAIVFGEKYEMPAERKAIALDPKIFDSYAGRYQLVDGPLLKITREGDRLMAGPEGQEPAQLFPESETKFFLKAVDGQISFVRDEAGAVTGLIFHNPGGKNIPGARVK